MKFGFRIPEFGFSKARVRSVARLTGLSAWRGFGCFYTSDNLTYAASISYYAVASLFPAFLLAFALLGGVTADEHDRGQVLQFVLQYFPSQFDFITQQLDEFRSRSFEISVVGTIILVWGALGFFGAITTAVNYAWGVDKQRSYWNHKLFSFLMLRAMDRLKRPGEGDREIALRGLSWIVNPYESGGVVIAIEITLGAAIAGPFDIDQAGLEAMITRVLSVPGRIHASDTVH